MENINSILSDFDQQNFQKYSDLINILNQNIFEKNSINYKDIIKQLIEIDNKYDGGLLWYLRKFYYNDTYFITHLLIPLEKNKKKYQWKYVVIKTSDYYQETFFYGNEYIRIKKINLLKNIILLILIIVLIII